MKLALATGLEFLKAIGPAKLFTLLSGVNVDRLLKLSQKIPQKRMVEILRNTPMKDVIWLIKNNNDENIVYFIHEFSDTDLTYLISHVERSYLLYWLNALPPERLVKVIKLTGVKNAHLAMVKIGNEKTLQLLQIVSDNDLKKITTQTKFPELIKLMNQMTVEFVKTFMKNHGVDEFIYMYKHVSANNLLMLFKRLGETKALSLMKLLGTEDSVSLMKAVHGMRFPKVKPPKKTKKEIGKTSKRNARKKQ